MQQFWLQPLSLRGLNCGRSAATQIASLGFRLALLSSEMAFYGNIWHELPNHDVAFAEAVRVYVLGGKIAIVDWRDNCSPPPEPPQEHRISDEAVVAFLKTKGCQMVASRPVGNTDTWLPRSERLRHKPRRRW